MLTFLIILGTVMLSTPFLSVCKMHEETFGVQIQVLFLLRGTKCWMNTTRWWKACFRHHLIPTQSHQVTYQNLLYHCLSMKPYLHHNIFIFTKFFMLFPLDSTDKTVQWLIRANDSELGVDIKKFVSSFTTSTACLIMVVGLHVL